MMIVFRNHHYIRFRLRWQYFIAKKGDDFYFFTTAFLLPLQLDR